MIHFLHFYTPILSLLSKTKTKSSLLSPHVFFFFWVGYEDSDESSSSPAEVSGSGGGAVVRRGGRPERRRVGAKSSTFFNIFRFFFTLLPTLFLFLNSKFSENEQSTLDLKQKE